MLVALLAAFAITGATATPADTLRGRVTDRSGHPIAHATIRIPQLARASETDADGRFTFTDIPSGTVRVNIATIGYAPVLKEVVVRDGTRLEVSLEPSPVELPALVVTGSVTPTDRLGTPLASATLEPDQLRRSQSVSIARAVEALPGVRSVTTGSQIAKPMIRGLSGQRILVLDGGHRLEDYSWSDEDGPSLDARLAGRVEVIRGPTSLLYGPDAIAGVVNAIPEAIPEARPTGDTWHSTTLELSGATNNAETGTTLRYQRGAARNGFRATLIGRRAASLHTPNGELDNTGFFALNGALAYGIRGERGSLSLRASHYGGEFRLLEANGPPASRLRSAQPEEGPVRKSRDERLQLDALRFAGAWRLEANAQFQQHSLVEVSDDANPAPGAGKETVAFDLLLNSLSAGVKAHRTIRDHLVATLGVTGSRQTNDSRGPIALVPEGTTTGVAVFALLERRTKRWSVLAGIRGDLSSLVAEANPSLAFAGDSRNYKAATGNLGAVFRPVSGLSLSANAGRGWRAPNLFELFSNGPKLSEARYEIGKASLATEVGTNVEASVRWEGPKFRGEITGFHNNIKNYIYIAPTGQTIGGLSVYQFRQTDARLSGAEASVEVDPLPAVSLRARIDGVRAVERGNDSPLPLIPPLRTVVGAEWHSLSFGWAGRAHVGADLIGVSRQNRLATIDLPTGGYSLVEFSAGFDRAVRGRSLAIELTVHNALNTSFRDFLSRYKAFALNPGRDVVMRVSMEL